MTLGNKRKFMMKSHIIVGLLAAALLLSGCAATMPGPGQVLPGSLFASTAQPVGMTLDQEYQAYPERFEILGLTEGTSSNVNVLGLVSIGNAGYIAAMEDAMQKVGADGLINCVADLRSTSVLFLFATNKTVVRGLAIKRKE
jgi:hypothetical protein